MIDINLVKHIMSVVANPDEDNSLTSWTDGIDLSYGSVMINDEHYVYIKAKELHEYKETLVDIQIPLAVFEKCRHEVKSHLLEMLIQPDTD